jgi:hypothetical protein
LALVVPISRGAAIIILNLQLDHSAEVNHPVSNGVANILLRVRFSEAGFHYVGKRLVQAPP